MMRRMVTGARSMATNNKVLLLRSKPVNDFQMNQYAFACPKTKQAAIVDSGCTSPEELTYFTQWIEDEGLKVTHLLQTHAHLDHVAGLPFVRDVFPQVPIFLHSLDKVNYEEAFSRAKSYGMYFPRQLPKDNIIDIKNESELTVGETRVKIYHTPGHAPGHVCFLVEDLGVLFGGDLIFKGGVGRTDLPYCSPSDMQSSLEFITDTIDENVTILSGHGSATCLIEEKKSNPFLQGF